MIADCRSVYWVYFCQKHLVSKDSYMSNSTTHFSQQTWPAAQNYYLLNTDATCARDNNIANCNKVNGTMADSQM